MTTAIAFMLRAIGAAAGLAFVAVGVPLTPLPIPLGIPFIILGLILIAASSKTAHRVITRALKRVPWLWRRVRFAFGERGAE